MMWEVFECLFFFYFKSIDIGIFQMNSVPICQKILKAPKRFSHPCKNDVMMSTKEFSTNFKAHLRLFNKNTQFFMGAKIYSQDVEIFAASCKNPILQPRKKGSPLLLV